MWQKILLGMIGIGFIAMAVLWVLIVELGDGTFKIWDWDSTSWQATLTGLAGFALSIFAGLSWRIQSLQAHMMKQQTEIRYADPVLFKSGGARVRRFQFEVDGIPSNIGPAICCPIRFVNRAEVGVTVAGVRTNIVKQEEGECPKKIVEDVIIFRTAPSGEVMDEYYSYALVPPHQYLDLMIAIGPEGLKLVGIKSSDRFNVELAVAYYPIADREPQDKDTIDETGRVMDVLYCGTGEFAGGVLFEFPDD